MMLVLHLWNTWQVGNNVTSRQTARGHHSPRHEQIGNGMAEAESLLTVAEVATELRVSTMTVYRLINSGDLPAFRIGKNYRIKRGDLDAYLHAGVVRADEKNG